MLEQRSVALVGARKSTESGRAIACSLAAGLVAHGCTVVSGLAVGTDAAAHRGALTALGGKTAAVLGSGFGHLYPEQNRGLAKAILSAGGLLMSEYPPRSPLSAGCHRMIRQGAALVTCVEEIAEEMGLPEPTPTPGERAIADLSSPLHEASVQILDAIAAKPRQLDEIAALIDRDSRRVGQCLMQLQLSGFVRRGPDGYIRLL